MPQAQTGSRKSIPKICEILADDSLKLIYKKVGNNHVYPIIWAETITVVSGTEVTVCSGVTFHGFDLASYGNFTITPLADPGNVRVYIDKNTTTNVVTLKSTGSLTNISFDLQAVVGVDPDIATIYCRGNTGASPNFP